MALILARFMIQGLKPGPEMLTKDLSACEVFGPDRLLFGSDYPMDFLEGKQIKVYLDNINAYLSPEDCRKVLGENALEVFNL